MTDSRPAIVIVAFNRPRSLKRLLDSLSKAHYPDDDIPLVISIDRGTDNEHVLDIAKSFTWQFGTKNVVYQEENLGLRNHVLQCGDLTNTYGSIIMLEDDLYVSPNFYHYAAGALNFSKDKSPIGGISLYNHQLNVHTNKNFQPIEDGYDNWYFQFASSWGQAWNSKQWNSFREWYDKKPSINDNRNVPQYVRNWSEKSWLKYFIAFLVIQDRYFLYPKISLTTNFSDAGTHVGEDSTVFQLPLLYAFKKEYNFSNLDESNAIYDAFYENRTLAEALGLSREELCVDLQGYKKIDGQKSKKFMLTVQKLDRKVVKTNGCSLKPIDANIIQDIAGDDIYLYDLNIEEKNNFGMGSRYRELTYNFKYVYMQEASIILINQLKGKVKRASKKIFG